MLYLLDTHILIWAVADPARLSREACDLIGEPSNQITFSPASIWEIAIKVRQGRTDFNFEPATILAAALATGFVEHPIRAAVSLHVRHLPDHHRDPLRPPPRRPGDRGRRRTPHRRRRAAGLFAARPPRLTAAA